MCLLIYPDGMYLFVFSYIVCFLLAPKLFVFCVGRKKTKKEASDQNPSAFPSSTVEGGSTMSNAASPPRKFSEPSLGAMPSSPEPKKSKGTSPLRTEKKTKKKVEIQTLEPSLSVEIDTVPLQKRRTRSPTTTSSLSVRSVGTNRSALFSGPRLTKLRALSPKKQSKAEMVIDGSTSQISIEENVSQVSVAFEEVILRASHCGRNVTVVSRGEWHDEMHDKRFQSVDKEISDINLEVKEQGYRQLLELLKTSPNDAEVLWRLAKVCNGIATLKGLNDDMAGKKQLVEEGVQHASRALELSPRSAEVHKWFAISVGSRSEFQPVKARIKDGFTFKEHIEEALKITPDDPTLLHLLGRFRFEVATLGWMERKIASSIFGEVPYATFPEALEPLLKVEILNKSPWKENRLIIAKCYIHMGESLKALEWLDNAYEVPCQSLDDERVHLEIQGLLEKHEKYRLKEPKKKK